MILALDDRVLIDESDTLDLYAYRDTKGTGVADQKELAFAGGKAALNVEHQQSGLLWAMDNWCYMTNKSMRLRFTSRVGKTGTNGLFGWLKGLLSPPKFTGKEVIVEPTPENGGQWGLTQDDYGKLWWSNGSAEIALYHFQTPIIYGAHDLSGTQPADFPVVWPLVGLADVQGGPDRFRPEDGTLNHFTAACGQEIVRGDRLPEDLRGDALVCEPVGRLIRRAKVELKEGITTIRNAYDHSEFIRSTDPCFRPVSVANGPDGCLYIVDMYRGVIQDSHWMHSSSYLYPVVQKLGLDKITGHGRIWRLVHEDYPPGPWPRLLEESSAQLVTHLESQNGWTRDTAQRLLVLRDDKSVVPALQKMAASDASPLGRIHALWTLEGLDSLDGSVIRRALKDTHPQVRIAAIRASESLLKRGDASLAADVKRLSYDSQPEVVLQTLLTGKLLQWPDFSAVAAKALAQCSSQGVKALGTMLMTDLPGVGGNEFPDAEMELLRRGQAIYQEVCFACHGFDGNGMPMDGPIPGATLAPALGGAREVVDSPDSIVRVLLHGLTGPVGGKTFSAQMISMETNDDAWIAAIASYTRNSFGNHGAVVTPVDVARLRAQTQGRTQPWSIAELQAAMPRRLEIKGRWKAVASVNSQDARLAIDGNSATRWSTGVPTQPGDWFQVELPEMVQVSGLRLVNAQATDEFPRSCEIRLSANGGDWGAPVARGHGTTGITEITFPPTSAKFIRVTNQMYHRKTPWSIDEVEVLLPPLSAPGGR
jgi:mono/diheme cytochrome c family protein